MITTDLNLVKKELIKGEPVAIPTETVYGLAANAFKATSVDKIFHLKQRPANNPLIVHIPNYEFLSKIACEIPESAKRLASAFWPGPLTLVLKKQKVIKPHTLILGAPTNNNFVIEERGVFWLEINVSGKTSHAGEPHKGVNAIEKSAKIINELNSSFKKFLKKYDIGTHKSTINVGIISGGENVNVVPSKTRIVVDRRITHKEDVKKAFNEIKNFILKIDRSAKVKFLTGTNPFKSNKSNIYLEELSKSKELITGQKSKFLSSIGVSDGRYFADDNVNIINIGPGTGSEGHKSNEKLINKDLVDYFLLLENFLLKF